MKEVVADPGVTWVGVGAVICDRRPVAVPERGRRESVSYVGISSDEGKRRNVVPAWDSSGPNIRHVRQQLGADLPLEILAD